MRSELGDRAAAAAAALAAFDNPEAYIARDRRRALADGVELPDRVYGAALFADISGFTPLTEALAMELGAQRGAEELTANLGRIFHAIIAELDRFGGEVIYFSGDAVTCWVDGDDGTRATAAALAMQEAMARVGEVVTPGGTVVQLAMKVAVAVGPARRFVVGDPDIQLIDVLAGRLVDELAAAEHLAGKGEVVLEESALDALGDRPEVAAIRIDEESGRRIALVTGLSVEVEESPVAEPGHSLPEELVRPWLLPAVYERIRTGRGEFLAEIRPAIPVFVHFTGIDYDADDDAVEKLDEFLRRAQRIFADYGGNLLQLTLGDKGAYLYAVFGSPHAHEDDAARAAAAALDLLELEQVTEARDLQVGIAHGRLRSGTYGHEMRRTFVCLGDAVNLAARLMSRAPVGQVYVAGAVREQAGDAFTWEQLPEMTVKGKAEPISVFALTGRARGAVRRRTRYELPIVGRGAELEALDAALARAHEARGAVVGIAAEAGVGKSRLVAEFVRRARRRGNVVAFGECQAFGTNTSYGVWREIWRSLFHLPDDEPEPVQAAILERELAAVDPALVARAPLLDALLGISIPDNDLTRSFEAELRKTSLEALLADCLRARAAEEPLVLVLEDCHWIDPLSRDLLLALARAAAGLRVLAVLAYRPAQEAGGGLGIERLAHFTELALSELEPDEAAQLIRGRLRQAGGDEAEPPPALVEIVTARSQGNPFYVEELLNYVQGQGVDLADEAALRALQLPESLHSLILSRVDTLSEAPRRTLKVASVVGRIFAAPALPAVYPELGSLEDVRGHLGALGALDLVQLDREEGEEYIFKHVVTQEVAYESTPFALRADLHERVGGYIEGSQADTIERNLDLLAHHYWLSENLGKKREYLVRAGDAAKANFANASAIDYFRRAAPLLEGRERWQLERRLGEVLEVTGDASSAEAAYRDALGLAGELGDPSAVGWTETSLAEVARKRGDYDQTLEWLDRARAHFEEQGDLAGAGRVLHISGTVAAMRGELPAAREQLEASLSIRRELGEKAAMGALYSNLAIVAEYAGDIERSCELHEEGLALRIDAGDTAGVAVSRMNLGVMLAALGRADEAREHQEESLRLRREMGDPRMIALGEHNLGLLTRSQGDYEATRELFAGALHVQRDQNDRWALGFMLEDIAVLAALVGEPEHGLRLASAGGALRAEIDATRGPDAQGELDGHIAACRAALGERADAVWEAGRTMPLEDAIREALAFCEPDCP
jgi:class 3 adenylate cyclase/tetratricopeptide (TPR) repeat protein